MRKEKRTPRTRASEEVRRQQILSAAFEVAAREGLAGVTLRAVAVEAELSHALVLFHFKQKDRLVLELLGWLLETTPVLEVPERIADSAPGVDRLHALLHQEVAELVEHPRQMRLFLEFWALGSRDERIRERVSQELDRYRSGIRAEIQEFLDFDPSALPTVTADGLASVAVSWIQGCAVQAIIDPKNFDRDGYFAAMRGLLDQQAGLGGASGRGRKAKPQAGMSG